MEKARWCLLESYAGWVMEAPWEEYIVAVGVPGSWS